MPFRRRSNPFRGGLQVSGRIELGSRLYSRPPTSFTTCAGLNWSSPFRFLNIGSQASIRRLKPSPHGSLESVACSAYQPVFPFSNSFTTAVGCRRDSRRCVPRQPNNQQANLREVNYERTSRVWSQCAGDGHVGLCGWIESARTFRRSGECFALGASNVKPNCGRVYDSTGAMIAHISYSGRASNEHVELMHQVGNGWGNPYAKRVQV